MPLFSTFDLSLSWLADVARSIGLVRALFCAFFKFAGIGKKEDLCLLI